MLRRLSIAAGLAASLLSAAPAFAASALDGLEHLKTYNVITYEDWKTNSHVGGRVLVGRDALGTSNGGTGEVGQASFPLSDIPTVVIVRNNTLDTLKVGTGNSAVVGGLSNYIQLNGSAPAYVQVGGNLNNGGNSMNLGDGAYVGVDGNLTGSLSLNGTAKVEAQTWKGGTDNEGKTGLVLGKPDDFNASAISDFTDVAAVVQADITALSDALAGLTLTTNPSGSSWNGSTLVLTAVKSTNDFALINLTAAQLNAASNLSYNFSSASTGPVIINVGPGAINFAGNFNGGNDTDAGKVIWNFLGSENINLNGSQFYGQILATKASVNLGNNNINGTIVAKNLTQNGEIHLVTYTGGNTFLPPVPEPATWAMMIAGMGFVGASMRRQARGSLRTA